MLVRLGDHGAGLGDVERDLLFQPDRDQQAQFLRNDAADGPADGAARGMADGDPGHPCAIVQGVRSLDVHVPLLHPVHRSEAVQVRRRLAIHEHEVGQRLCLPDGFRLGRRRATGDVRAPIYSPASEFFVDAAVRRARGDHNDPVPHLLLDKGEAGHSPGNQSLGLGDSQDDFCFHGSPYWMVMRPSSCAYRAGPIPLTSRRSSRRWKGPCASR